MHWFVVASQKEARVFVGMSDDENLRLLQSLTNPLGAEKRRDLIKKKAGRGVKSIGRLASINYSTPQRSDPHEDAILQFSRQLARFLESEKHKKNFESLTIVAEPHLLGKIRTQMSDHLKHSVTNWIKKDLQKTPQKDLANYLLPIEESHL